MKTATRVRSNLHWGHGAAHLYRLSEPLGGHDLVAVSAVSGLVTETYIFGADENGEVVDWGELDGSERGHTDHARALRAAGYDVR